jgi:pimeloyl-ACP methyl ester carboxylesterase
VALFNAGLANDLAWVCDQLKLTKPVRAQHGRRRRVRLAARYPDLASAIVMLDAAVVLPSAARAGLMQFMEELQGEDYRAVALGYVADVFLIPTDDAAPGMISTPRHVMMSMLEGLRDDPVLANGHIALPCLDIAANEPRPRSDLSTLRELIPQRSYDQTA